MNGFKVRLALLQPFARIKLNVANGAEPRLDTGIAQVLPPDVGILDVPHQIKAVKGAIQVPLDHFADKAAHQVKGTHPIPFGVTVGRLRTRLLGRGQRRLDAPCRGGENGSQNAFEVESSPAAGGNDELGRLQVELTEPFAQGVEAHRGMLGDAEFAGSWMLSANEEINEGRPRRRRKFLVRGG